MPTIRFQVFTDLPPDRVLQALIDFSDQRPIVWPKIDRSHFRVHGQGPDWAEVTEGNALAWERNRYEWNAAAGEVIVVRPPFGLPHDGEYESVQLEPLFDALATDHVVAALLVRLGGSATLWLRPSCGPVTGNIWHFREEARSTSLVGMAREPAN